MRRKIGKIIRGVMCFVGLSVISLVVFWGFCIGLVLIVYS